MPDAKAVHWWLRPARGPWITRDVCPPGRASLRECGEKQASRSRRFRGGSGTRPARRRSIPRRRPPRLRTTPACDGRADPRDRRGAGAVAARQPWRDGTTDVVFDPVEFLGRLAVLVPRPRINLILYYGVLGPRARGGLKWFRARHQKMVAMWERSRPPNRLLTLILRRRRGVTPAVSAGRP